MNSNGFVYFLTESQTSSPYSSICALISHKYMFNVWETNIAVVDDAVISNSDSDGDDDDADADADALAGIFKLCNFGNS